VNSVITGKQTRDDDLRSDNFFAAARHPVIANGSTGIRRDGGDLVIDGELTIRGVTRPASSALTAAELRLLPLLSTHLSFPQIAGEMFLSRHTIKSQAMSIYRKLGAPSRSQAVARSRELGLPEG
jgi:DNA-binding CsgD family transcriptional regulator